MLTRRRFLNLTASLPPSLLLASGCAREATDASGAWVNDIHAQLNRTYVRQLHRPQSIASLQALVRDAATADRPIAIAGGRHAMGGQQFATDGDLIDTRALNRVLGFDAEKGSIEVEAGIDWPAVIDHLLREQRNRPRQWGIAQKQTGADRLTLGGALSANVHGRGLAMKPIIADVEAFTLIGADGALRRCSRQENAELFRLAIGGYGLFGAIATITLRLIPRIKLERVVEVIDLDALPSGIEERIAAGYRYGDFQYSTDMDSDGFLRRGVFSCYRPVDPQVPISETQKELSEDDWRRLLYLGHVDKKRAFDVYAGYYLSTSGQLYWSDTHQLSTYIDDYHRDLDRQLGAREPASEMISEIYVPRSSLVGFMAQVARDFRDNDVNVIYGTIRLIERDEESFLPWARDRFACVIFNLHVAHSPAGLDKAAVDFRRLIDRGLRFGGGYYLTYHRWATRDQVTACYPQFAEFLRLKRKYDPAERFQSDWYRHYNAMFAAA